MLFQPMPLSGKTEPFNHPDWRFEVKWDGFRCLAYLDRAWGLQACFAQQERVQILSGTEQGSPVGVQSQTRAVLDGEIVCLDRKGSPPSLRCLFLLNRGRGFSDHI